MTSQYEIFKKLIAHCKEYGFVFPVYDFVEFKRKTMNITGKITGINEIYLSENLQILLI